MIDKTTNKPLHVSRDGTAGPYIMVPLDQLGDVQRLLDQYGIGYSVESNAISLNGAPFISVIDLGRKGNAERVQAILDEAK